MPSVLVVEDDVTFRASLARSLRGHGYDVFEASSVDDALGALGGDPIDVLLTDLRMDEKDGIDLLHEASKVSAATRTILMSAYASAKDYQTAVNLGAVKVLCKPFTPQALLETVQEAVECGTGFRASLHGVSLVDMLQLLHYSQRSVRISFTGSADAEIFLQHGEFVHARCGEATGEAALALILAAPSGIVRSAALSKEPPHTISRPFQPVLLDALRSNDERGQESDEPPFIDPTTDDLTGAAAEESPSLIDLDALSTKDLDTLAGSKSLPPEDGPWNLAEKSALVDLQSIASELSGVTSVLDQTCPSSSAVVVSLASGTHERLRGHGWSDESCKALNQLVDQARSSFGDFDSVELLGATSAIAAAKVDKHHVVAIQSPTVGTVSTHRFRSYVVHALSVARRVLGGERP